MEGAFREWRPLMTTARRILIATDAWHPQVNGVVRTVDTTVIELRRLGHTVCVVEPGPFFQVPVPFYPEIPLSVPPPTAVYRQVRRFRPDYVHICTEGPIGLLVRRYCLAHDWGFTSSYHTRFPEYLHRMIWLPVAFTYRYLWWFHRAAQAVMVATPTLQTELAKFKLNRRLVRWSRGVDLRLFYPRPKTPTPDARPILLYVGRVSYEKNIAEFLKLDLPGTKYVVGDGPIRAQLEAEYPQVRFLGFLKGEALAAAYANADVFVFPSQTDTFGLVIVEALASGVPVAAYPVTGPIDILSSPAVGAVAADLATAVRLALERGQPEACVRLAHSYSWTGSTEQFLRNLVPVAMPVRV
jgi:glycosyltransferase involved in cell wall biosynthesis